MRGEQLYRAMGGVGEDLIARADQPAPVKKNNVIWVKWAAMAACCVLVIALAALVLPEWGAKSEADMAPGNLAKGMEAMAETPAEAAAPAESAPEAMMDVATAESTADLPAAAAPEETPMEEPAMEAPAPMPESEAPAASAAQEGELVFAGGEIIGSFEDIVSYNLYQPEFRGLATQEAEVAINDFYGQQVMSLVDYAYETVYKEALERHTGADVIGTCQVLPSQDENVLRVGYVLEVQYGDGSDPIRWERVDEFDRNTGLQINKER